MLYSRLQSEKDLSRLQTANTAALLARGAAATIDKARLAVDSVADRIEHDLRTHGLQRAVIWPTVDRAVARVPELQTIGLFDRTGQQICGEPAERCRQLNVADRDFFVRYRDAPESSTNLFGPVESRLDGRPVLILVRALRLEDGGFGGVALGLLPLANLNAIVGTASLGPSGVASLRTAGELSLLARAPAIPAERHAAQTAALRTAIGDLMQRAPDTGLFTAESTIDGATRINAYHKLPGYPVYAFVADAVADSQALWRSMLAGTIGFLLVFMALSVAIERFATRSRRSELRAQLLFDEAPCGYHTLDAEGRFTSINATEARWFGVSREELIGKVHIAQLMTDEGRATFAKHFPRMLAGEGIQDLEYDLVAKDGSVRRLSVSATPVLDAQGRFVSSNSVMYDISALHQARLALREQNVRQQLMLDNELVSLARVKDRRFVWKNKAFGRMFGYEAGELIGQETSVLFPDKAAFEAFGLDFGPKLAAGGNHRATIELRRKDGTALWADCIGTMPDPSTGEAMWFAIDVTASRRAEALRIEASELAAENRQLQETARLHSKFLSNMSHELRTPLNGIIGLTDILKRSATNVDPDKRDRYLAQIASGGRHLLAMIESMLDLAKLESGRLPLHPEPLDLGAVVQEVIDMLEPKAQANQVQVRALVEALPTVRLDPLRLKQVLLNYLGNAIKFSRPGGIVLVKASLPRPDRLRVEVEDEGIGIADEDQARLFVRFRQLSAGTTKAYEGTGIGLALVKQIVEAQGGQVGVRSEVGKGSVFWADLPVAT